MWARSRAADSDGHKTRAPHGATLIDPIWLTTAIAESLACVKG